MPPSAQSRQVGSASEKSVKMTALREKERLRREAERVDATDDGDGM